MDEERPGIDPAQNGPGKPDTVIRVAIVDDHQLMTEVLALVLDQAPGLTLVGSTDSCATAPEMVARTCPDVLLLDVSLPDGDGLALIPALRTQCPNTPILVLTSMADASTLLRALEVGVSGFVAKHQPVSDVLVAIRQAAEGQVVMPARLLVGLLAQQLPSTPRHSPRPFPQEPLTAREREVLACAADGLSTAQIAQRLSISALTVRTHLRNVIGKLHAHSRLEAVAIALRQGLIPRPR